MNTQKCQLFLKGNCRKGSRCKYSHEVVQTQPEPIQQQKSKPYNDKQQYQKQQHFEKIKNFVDLSKLEETQAIFEYNQSLYGGDFFACAKQAITLREKEILQFFRRFQSSIKLLPSPKDQMLLPYIRNTPEILMEIKYIPTVSRKLLNFKTIISEGYFQIMVAIIQEYPDSQAMFSMTNPSVEQEFKNSFTQMCQNMHLQQGKPFRLANTIKAIDNDIDRLCNSLEDYKIVKVVQDENDQEVTNDDIN